MEEIERSPAASVLLFSDIETSIDLIHYCREQRLPFALETEELKSMLFAQALGAGYILTGGDSADSFQSVAQHYLFDMQIAVVIQGEEEIEHYAALGIDAVVFASSIQRRGGLKNAG